jgi:hypothetical protein
VTDAPAVARRGGRGIAAEPTPHEEKLAAIEQRIEALADRVAARHQRRPYEADQVAELEAAGPAFAPLCAGITAAIQGADVATIGWAIKAAADL